MTTDTDTAAAPETPALPDLRPGRDIFAGVLAAMPEAKAIFTGPHPAVPEEPDFSDLLARAAKDMVGWGRLTDACIAEGQAEMPDRIRRTRPSRPILVAVGLGDPEPPAGPPVPAHGDQQDDDAPEPALDSAEGC